MFFITYTGVGCLTPRVVWLESAVSLSVSGMIVVEVERSIRIVLGSRGRGGRGRENISFRKPRASMVIVSDQQVVKDTIG